MTQVFVSAAQTPQTTARLEERLELQSLNPTTREPDQNAVTISHYWIIFQMAVRVCVCVCFSSRADAGKCHPEAAHTNTSARTVAHTHTAHMNEGFWSAVQKGCAGELTGRAKCLNASPVSASEGCLPSSLVSLSQVLSSRSLTPRPLLSAVP